MANKTLFSSIKGNFTRTDTVNEAGGRAYNFAPKHALAQMAATGCFNGVYYASAQNQLDEMRKLIDQVDDNVFLAKLAVYAREAPMTDIQLPFKLENALEQRIAADPEWLAGVDWGRPRHGHLEGTIKAHVAAVLQNVDDFYGDSLLRADLRLIALVHDTLRTSRLPCASRTSALRTPV